MSAEEAAAFAAEQGVAYAETSAKTGAGVEDAFLRTVAAAWDRAAKGHLVLRDNERPSVVLKAKNPAASQSTSCC